MAERKLRIVTGPMAVVALVLGALLAVASVPVGAVVAWAPQVLEWDWWWAGDERFVDEPRGVMYQRRDGPMATLWDAQRKGRFSDAVLRNFETRDFTWVTSDPRPGYARLELVGEDGEATVYAVGWPMRAAYATSPEGDHPAIRGTELWEPRLFGERWPIPYQPRWFGLVVNAVFYGSLVLAVLALGRWWRVRRRIERGRCGACGYELGEGVSVCPECGLGAVRAPVERG